MRLYRRGHYPEILALFGRRGNGLRIHSYPQKNGQWQDRNYLPQAGNLIFFDWEGDGRCNHVGIVEKCEEGVVYTIEGNSGDACKLQHYTVNSRKIFGYGCPMY